MPDIKMILNYSDLEVYAKEFTDADIAKAIGPVKEPRKYSYIDFYTNSEERLRNSISVQLENGIVPTVFISHKHADLPQLRGLLGLLKHTYGVSVYIDSKDPSMPRVTSDITAKRIKAKIRRCDRFILLATNNAIESKWCNWELGYGDAKKYKKGISILPLISDNALSANYKGTEYMRIYPHIAYSPSCGRNEFRGCDDNYCVYIQTVNGERKFPLYDWLWYDRHKNLY